MKSKAPTSPGRRQMSTVDYSGLSKSRPHKRLTVRLKTKAGRNSSGRITMRHQGGGNKRLYRRIDFKRTGYIDQRATVERMEYDPYRTAFIALVVYPNGEKSYILAPHSLEIGAELVCSDSAPTKTGNRMKLKNIVVGQAVYNVELEPGKGGMLARSAGSSLEVLANADGFSDLKLPSGEVRRVPWEGFASIGRVSNAEHNLIKLGKAGRSRWMGVRPTVRGSAMNPVDHKYGGGEGRAQRGTKRPKDIWGNITGGRKTRKKGKKSNRLIIKRRKKK